MAADGVEQAKKIYNGMTVIRKKSETHWWVVNGIASELLADENSNSFHLIEVFQR